MDYNSDIIIVSEVNIHKIKKKFCENDKFIIESKKNDLNSDKKRDTIRYRNLVLSGGSIRGISHIGALHKLIQEKLINLDEIRVIAGTSAGALIGCLLILKFNIDEIWDLVKNLNMKRLINPDLLMFLEECGIDRGETVLKFIEDVLYAKTGIKDITFIQLYEKTNIEYIVVGSCLTRKKPVYFNHINTPNTKISLAIRISISIPIVFTPIKMNNEIYVDGAIIDNYPIHLFEGKMEETIGILIDNEYNTDYNYPEEYIMAIINLLLYNYYNERCTRYEKNTIYIQNIIDISPFNFGIDNQIKGLLYKSGVDAVGRFIKKMKEESK
uniref:PNPLA domain-containing protein n=1 Tax=viral metagenome TaxID=1070528 RepID=A0A6C0LTT4_9ZZZZ